jgi:midasin
VPRHKDFRIFACMNPATDVGKRDLPAALRAKFTEFYVDELEDKDDLRLFVRSYMAESVPNCPVDQVHCILQIA